MHPTGMLSCFCVVRSGLYGYQCNSSQMMTEKNTSLWFSVNRPLSFVPSNRSLNNIKSVLCIFIFRHERQQRHERQDRKKRKRKSDDDCFDLGYDIPISPEKNLTKHLTRRYAKVCLTKWPLLCSNNIGF